MQMAMDAVIAIETFGSKRRWMEAASDGDRERMLELRDNLISH